MDFIVGFNLSVFRFIGRFVLLFVVVSEGFVLGVNNWLMLVCSSSETSVSSSSSVCSQMYSNNASVDFGVRANVLLERDTIIDLPTSMTTFLFSVSTFSTRKGT